MRITKDERVNFMEKMLIVGGTWGASTESERNWAPSGFVSKFAESVHRCFEGNITVYNGGPYSAIKDILKTVGQYDYVFWWANVDNSLPKLINVKEVAPKVMLINSKRCDDDKYAFGDMVQRALIAKANLSFWFKKNEDGLISMTVFDPLGSVWYQGENIENAAYATVERLRFLKSMTRQSSQKSETNKNLIMAWYFDQFKQDEYKSDKTIPIPDENDFVNVVKQYAEEFQKFTPAASTTQRFIGNASLRPLPPQVGRCGKGMPSFKHDGVVFVSKRNIDKRFIELDNFVPCYMEGDKLMYCGEDKPSVDTPVQMRLYEALPQINYMLHSHCYIKGAPFTDVAIPCGAIEEASEVLSVVEKQSLQNNKWIAINLLGHGALLMWSDMDEFHQNVEPVVEYYKRAMPEFMF